MESRTPVAAGRPVPPRSALSRYCRIAFSPRPSPPSSRWCHISTRCASRSPSPSSARRHDPMRGLMTGRGQRRSAGSSTMPARKALGPISPQQRSRCVLFNLRRTGERARVAVAMSERETMPSTDRCSTQLLAALMIVTLWLTGCAMAGSDTRAPCPPVVDYRAADQPASRRGGAAESYCRPDAERLRRAARPRGRAQIRLGEAPRGASARRLDRSALPDPVHRFTLSTSGRDSSQVAVIAGHACPAWRWAHQYLR